MKISESWKKYLLEKMLLENIQILHESIFVGNLSKAASNYLWPTVIYSLLAAPYIDGNHQTK